jgi:signal transduction histidine kinase
MWDLASSSQRVKTLSVGQQMPTWKDMLSPRIANSSVGQTLPWFVAALLVALGSGLIAMWLNATALKSDRDTLARGADAIQSSVEEQIRILQLAGTGTRSLAGQPIDEIDLTAVVKEIDISVLRSLLAVVAYPVDAAGAGKGAPLLDIDSPLSNVDFEVPDIEISLAEFRDLQEEGEMFLSQPLVVSDSERLDYIVAMPIDSDIGPQLIGVAFRPDRMLSSAVEAAGEGQYAVDVIDVRFGNQLVLSIGEPASELEEVRSPDGTKRALDLVVRPGEEFHFAQSPWIVILVLATGMVIALLLVWMGRMAKARSESLAERLRLAQDLNESKDRFLATVSHELRTPLTVVLGVAAELGPNWATYEELERQELMTMMTEQAVEAANIVEDLLVAARSDPSQLRLAIERTNLRSHVEYAIGSLTDEGRHRVDSRVGDVAVLADTTRLRQILRNLLENAVRYGGDTIAVETTIDGDRLIVVVADNGSNIDDDDLERIFEPYEQTDAVAEETLSGVGIGLYVSRLLARLMGGELDCVREEAWTKFRLDLPAVAVDELAVATVS